MTELLQVAQAVPAEPLLIGGSVAVAGGCFVWAAKTLLEVRDHSRSLRIAVFGDEDDPEPNGLKREVKAISTKLDKHVVDHERESVWVSRILKEHTDRLVDQ